MVRAVVFAATGVVAAIAAWSHVLLDQPHAANACGDAGPFDFDTIEPAASDEVYSLIINLATQGSLVVGEFAAGGEVVDLRYQGLLNGPRGARTTEPDPAIRIPPSVYYAIAWVEANWANASHTVPWGGIGPTLRSFDCGYGIGQITTGMRNNSGVPTAKQALVGVHPGFNVAEGIRILADKWNSAPEFRPIAGNGDPAALEDWYYAIWSYNGFAFVNHPFNPGRDPLRNGNGIDMIYHCYDGTAPSYIDVGGELPLYAYGDYTYPERVYGCMRFPPEVSPLRAPERAGQDLWQPVEFNMPFFHRDEVAASFDPVVWDVCDVLVDGCAAMDFPTSFEDVEVVPHLDPVAPIDPSLALQVFGQPFLTIGGPTNADLEILDNSGVSQTVRVTVTNDGTWLGVYRVRSSAPWLVARHPGDQVSRTLDAGLAVGLETEIVVIADPLRTRAGYTAEIDIALDWRWMVVGSQQGTITIEPLWGTGEPLTIAVSGSTAFEAPPEPTPTPTPIPQPTLANPTATPETHGAHAPGLSVSE
jgi:hypothetical protein